MKEWVIQSKHQDWSPWSVFWYEDGGVHGHWLKVCEDRATPFHVDKEADERYARGELSTTRIYWARTLEDCIRIYACAMKNRIQIVPFRFFNMRTGETIPTELI